MCICVCIWVHACHGVWQSEKNLQEWSLPLPYESWRWNLGLTDRFWRCFYMSQLWGVFQHLDIDHYKVKVRDEAVMNHMAPNVESVVAEIHWCVQE